MSWTTVRGHRPVGPRYRERPLGDPEDALIDEVVRSQLRPNSTSPRQPALEEVFRAALPQKGTCGELYDCEHVAALVID